ncbi:unnamed protein product [Caenorhabditis nigoni]
MFTVVLKAIQVAGLSLFQTEDIDVFINTYYAFIATVLDVMISPLLIQIPYLFCNRRNVKAMRERMTFSYLWSKIRYGQRENRIGVAANGMQSTTR